MNKHLRSALDKIGANPHLFNFLQRVCNFGDLKTEVSSRLQADREDSILDIGCGTGLYSSLARGRYVGIDLNPAYIKYASSRHREDNKTFIVGDITKLDLKGEMFDNTLYLAMLHHFNQEDNIKILKKISSLTKKKVIILDLTLPDKPTPMQKFFLTVERGRYLRPLNEQIQIIQQVFDIADTSLVLNRSKFGLFSIIKCHPRDNQAQAGGIK